MSQLNACSQIGIVCRYEELKRQLGEAQEAAQIEDEEAEVARAADALARLTAPAGARAGSAAAAAAAAAGPSVQTGGDGGFTSSSKRVRGHFPLSRYCLSWRQGTHTVSAAHSSSFLYFSLTSFL